MRPPMYKIAQSWDYMISWLRHKTWDPNADPDAKNEAYIRNKIVIVTGSNAGIGRQAAFQFAKRGAIVIMACRDLKKAKDAADFITERIPDVKIEIMKLDLGDLQSIRDFVKEFSRKYDELNILINNAGVMNSSGKPLKTEDGFEYHMGINHLGPFLLTRLLINALKKGAPSRVVSVASSNMALSPIDLDDLLMEKGVKTGDNGFEPYNVSKLSNAMCIRRLASLLKPGSGIRFFQICPGFVITELFRNERGLKSFIEKIGLRVIGISPEMGCETMVYCATSKKLMEDQDCGKGEIYRFGQFWISGNTFLIPDDHDTIKLYKISEQRVGL